MPGKVSKEDVTMGEEEAKAARKAAKKAAKKAKKEEHMEPEAEEEDDGEAKAAKKAVKEAKKAKKEAEAAGEGKKKRKAGEEEDEEDEENEENEEAKQKAEKKTAKKAKKLAEAVAPEAKAKEGKKDQEGKEGKKDKPKGPLSEEDKYREELGINVSGGGGKEIPACIRKLADAPFDKGVISAMTGAGFSDPSSIQAQCWPVAVEGSDLVAVAKTGSGKTLGFLLPAFRMIAAKKKSATGRCPTINLVFPRFPFLPLAFRRP